MTFAAQPKRDLTAEEIRAFQEDGVVMLKQALEPNWVAMAEAGIEQARRESSLLGRFMSRKVEGYQMDIFLWKRIDILRDLIYYSPCAHLARQLMGAEEVRFSTTRCSSRNRAPTPHALAPGSELLADSWRADLFVLDPLRPGEPGQQRPALCARLAPLAAAL